MRTVHTEVFKYAELSDSAKAKAREWWRETEARSGDTFFAESVTEDFKEVLTACGFSLSRRHGRDALYWSGFWSQGDGACFSASWSASDVSVAKLIADRPATYTDSDGKEQTCKSNSELLLLLREAARIATLAPGSFGDTDAAHRGMYQTATEWHSGADDDDGMNDSAYAELDTAFEQLCRDLAGYFYRQLEREYEYQNSDEVVADMLEANEYEFTADGDFHS